MNLQSHLPGRALPLSFAEYHSYHPQPNPHKINCQYHDKFKKKGGCFVKVTEGYKVSKLIRSPPKTCTGTGLCHISATFPANPTFSENFRSSLSFSKLLKMADINPTLPLFNPHVNFNQTITMTFEGPGTREIWFKPISWSVTGFYRSTESKDAKGQQCYVSLDFPLSVANYPDFIYSLIDPNF
ncbi:hypothetical protein DSO57_1031356 [Entomophthora muscae]|uniref:Uncharacterized protein n=1 Tax=Entomophthora muscae TaxID=34485 RepID=A0ACC2RRP3_9FUNG|nr:hypothetical protein DSO57_1031356 [Entomophthora muscae]